MSAALNAALAAGVVVAAWYGGKAAEWFLASKHCYPFVRRVAYTLLVLSMLQGFLRVLM